MGNSSSSHRVTMSGPGKVSKSYQEVDPVKEYCLSNSTAPISVQQKLQQETLTLSNGRMLGAPEVLALNTLLVQSLAAKKVLDIGVFTGASSLAAALALPKDGEVIACDVSDTHDKLIESGQENSFDFAFIDADKEGYDTYFEQCLKLIRKGGIIAFDNTLLGGAVVNADSQRPGVVAVRKLNEKIGKDARVRAVQMNIGDGYTLCAKL